MKALIAALILVPAPASASAVERALEAELSRASRDLVAEGYPRPYYVSVTATDVENWEARCPMGSRGLETRFRQRVLTPDLRVGDYAMDNHPVSLPTGFIGRMASLEDDEFALRHALWRLFDQVYKSATADFLRKQALRVSRGKTEYDTDDLTREAPRTRLAAQPRAPWSHDALRSLCLEAGRAFRREPGLLHAEAGVRTRRQWSRLRDSEGTKADFGRDVAEVEIEAVALSTDGTRVFAYRRFAATVPEGLPKPGELKAAASEMLSDLKAMQVAPTTAPLSAPALLDPTISAAVVQAIAGRLSGEEQRNPSGAQTFRDKIGKPVLPAGITLEDDPTLKSFGGVPLAGHYEYDDQGMPARSVTLVKDGVLKGLLLSRHPVIGFPRSNGHGRAFPGYWPTGSPGTLILRPEGGLSEETLLSLLREECRRRGKPYGLWVRKLRTYSQYQGTGGQGSIRVMPGLLYLVDAATGELTLVRDLDMVGTPLVLMNNILRAGKDLTVVNSAAPLPVSVVAPSLLLSEVEVQRAETKPEKAPILAPPPLEVTP